MQQNRKKKIQQIWENGNKKINNKIQSNDIEYEKFRENLLSE